MIDYHSTLIDTLGTVLPTHYEMTITSKTAVPCITFLELNNYSTNNGDTLGYSRLSYQVKVWDKDLTELQKYALQIDEVLRPLGWTRVSCRELYDNNSTMIQKIMTYEALALEKY